MDIIITRIPTIKVLDVARKIISIDGEKFVGLKRRTITDPFTELNYLTVTIAKLLYYSTNFADSKATYDREFDYLYITLGDKTIESIDRLSEIIDDNGGIGDYQLFIPVEVKDFIDELKKRFVGTCSIGPNNCKNFKDVDDFRISNIPKVLVYGPSSTNIVGHNTSIYYYFDSNLYKKYSRKSS